MTIGLLILIIAVGLLCLFAEFFLLPGLSIAGILGGLILITAIYLAYTMSVTTGHITLFASFVASGLTFWIGLKRLSSRQFAVHEVVEGRVNVLEKGSVHAGDAGQALSALRPGGKALIGGRRFEVFSIGEFLETGSDLVVTKVEGSKIWVKAAPSQSEPGAGDSGEGSR